MQHDLIPLSRHQRAIWLEALLYPDKPIFNIGTYVLLQGIPDAAVLERAIQNTIAKHDALRMQVVKNGKEPALVFNEKVDFQLSIISFENEDKARQWMDANFVFPIAVDAACLFEIKLVTFENKSFLYFKHHHIYIDGWARALLVQRIAKNYTALLQNEESDLNSSFKKQLSKASLQIDKTTSDFWKQQFDESFERTAFFDPLNELSLLPSSRFIAQWKSELFYRENDQKEQFYRQLAALCATFCISNGREEITVGIPLLNRQNTIDLETIGYYVGLIPLRIKIPTNCSFETLVANVRMEVQKTKPYRNISIQEINREIGMHQSDFHQAYDIVFSFESHNHACQFDTIETLEAGTFSSNFEQNPLVIHAQQFIDPYTVDFVWDYNQKYLNQDLVSSMSARFLRVLEFISSNSTALLSELPILSANESAKIATFSQGKQATLPFENLYEWIQETASERSDTTVLFDDETEYTFEAIISEAKKVAAYIQQKQLRTGSHIGIMLPRSAEVIIALTACIFAGVPYTYIDPTLGIERKKQILKSANIQLLISKEMQSDLATEHIALWSESNYEWHPPTTRGSDAVYAFFTSGSTGTPKGVSIPNEGIVNLIHELACSFFHDSLENQQLALVSAFSFDASVQFIFSCLCLGYPLHIVPETARKDGRELAHFLSAKNITHTDGIPSYLTALYLRNRQPPKGLKKSHFLIGGEAMQLNQIEKFCTWIGRTVQITNAYGPTECSVDTTLFHFDSDTIHSMTEIPIGRPVSNVNIHILDPRGIPVPIGAKGELHISGIGLAREYLNAPEQTKKAFINHPEHGRMYRSGDLASWRSDGNILCHGRSDHQVKIRGFRIELTEIEEALIRLPQVAQACVVVQVKGQTKLLVAVIQLTTAIDDASLKLALLKSIPEYMIPHNFVRLVEFPKTASGKMDRKGLSKIAFASSPTVNIQVETQTEKKIARIVSTLLEIESPDAVQSFFSLGGDSLTLVYLIAELEEAFDLELPIHLIADRNSIREIADFLDHKINVESPKVDLDQATEKALHWEFPKTLPAKAAQSVALLTGATGFVGAFLLKEILERFETVYCLIRSTSKQHAQERLTSVLEEFALEIDPADPRIHYLSGDLETSQLGLTHEEWRTISQEVSTIFHSGAEVHFLKNVDTMTAANVNGTSELLRLSCTETLKSFHFISTVGIFTERDQEINELHPIEHQIHTENNGYEATKWISESLVNNARNNGIPCSIYRLARVTGHSETGTAHLDDFFHRFFRGALDLGLFPEILLDRDTDLTPIDIVAKSVLEIAAKSEQGIFHLINPNRTKYADFIQQLNAQETRLKVVPTDVFLEKSAQYSLSSKHPLYTILPILKQKSWFSVNSTMFVLSDTLKVMRACGIHWPNAHDLQKTYSKRTFLLKDENGSITSIKTH